MTPDFCSAHWERTGEKLPAYKMGCLLVALLFLLCAATAQAQRSAAQVRAFRKLHPCPVTGQTTGACPGWVVDHRVPLCAGGKDAPANMQWQRKEESLIKDKQEWAICRQLREWRDAPPADERK